MKYSLPSPSFGNILKRTALPFLIFAAALMGLLTISYTLLLPKLTQVEVAGERRSAVQMRSHVQRLEASILNMQETRDQLIVPLQEGLYGDAKREKFSVPNLTVLRSQILELAAQIVPSQNDAVVVTHIRFLSDEGVLELSGEVRHVGPRSMTVLAQFVDAVKELPRVTNVELPSFKREHNETVGYYSPFTFRCLFE